MHSPLFDPTSLPIEMLPTGKTDIPENRSKQIHGEAPMRNDLNETLHKIQHLLRDGGEVGRKRLEELGAEAMVAFDDAIKAVDRRINARQEILDRNEILKKWKVGFLKKLLPLELRSFFAMPFIYGMIVPAIFLHLTLELYQQVCFRLYRIPRVRARDYFFFERALLPYLNWLEKINCVYCSYVNQLFQFAVEVGGRTERFWCPIKYANRVQKTHAYYDGFVDYLDAENFREKWERLRDFSDIEALRTDGKDSMSKQGNKE